MSAPTPAEPTPPPAPAPDSTRDAMPFFARPWRRLLEGRFGGAALFVVVFLALAWAMRVVLLVQSIADIDWSFSLLGAFACGTIFDLAAAGWWSLPIVLLLAALPRRFFAWPVGRGLAHLGLLGAGWLLLFGAVAEWFFWAEFGGRFNFIAVDYLIYTKEVVGNIRESYPMPAIYAGITAGALLLWYGLHRTGWIRRWLDRAEASAGTRWRTAAVLALVAVAFGLVLDERQIPSFRNQYHRELAKNGLWSLFAAFRANQLDFDRFYPLLPAEESFRRVQDKLAAEGAQPLTTTPGDLLRQVPAPRPGPERHPNIIQITVESLSASFFARYGGRENLTPHLDALMARSLVFDRFYATGNRTDRGMEALTLSVPPTPGRSLVKRPDNAHLFTLGSVLQQRGYRTAFVYGGYGYFDNMNAFFGGNGYRVVDRTSVASADISFANVWGACDEDLFRWTLREADRDAATGKPFGYFVMTTSNHRPFTFPAGKIDLPSKTSGRQGGVKYTDYAIDAFLREAATRPWYRDTVFVIVADHCASSAGKTELPVENYHIPLIIFAPGGHIAPGVIDTLSSQIDFAPTLLGLLNWSYPSRFFGRNLAAAQPGTPGRAFIANYQKLGLLQNNELCVLQPIRLARTFTYDPATHALPRRAPDPELLADTIAYYQTACYAFKHGLQGEITPATKVAATAASRATPTPAAPAPRAH